MVESESSNPAHSNEKNPSSILKNKIKHIEQKLRATLLYLKAFSDIVNSFESKIENSNANTYEEDFEEEEDGSGSVEDDKSEIEKRIFQSVDSILNKLNYEPLNKMLNKEFLMNLINFFSNLTIEEFLLNDFDKMIMIKELLFDLEFLALSLINNIVRSFNGILNNDENLIIGITNTEMKRILIEEYSKNQEFLTVLLTTFRNILEKYPNIYKLVVKYFIKKFRILVNLNIKHYLLFSITILMIVL